MKKMKLFLIVCCLAAACKTKKMPPAINYDYEVESINQTGVEGTVIFKVWSYANTNDGAIGMAKYNAVHAVLFKGIPGTNFSTPMVTDPAAKSKNKTYFDEFFKENGQYLSYATLSNDGSIGLGDRLQVGKLYKVGVIVQVNYSLLRKELENKSIIRKFGY